MNNSSILVYSFLHNLKKVLNKQLDDFSGIFKTNKYGFYRSNEYLQIKYKKIYNEIENHVYTYKDVFRYMLYKYAFNEPVNIYAIDAKEIVQIKKIFTKKQLEKDEAFINELLQKSEMKSIDELFIIRESGEPIVYDLIKRNFISILFYIKYYNKVLTTINKDDIFKNNNFKIFEYAIKHIIK